MCLYVFDWNRQRERYYCVFVYLCESVWVSQSLCMFMSIYVIILYVIDAAVFKNDWRRSHTQPLPLLPQNYSLMASTLRVKIRDMPHCGYNGTLCNTPETVYKKIAFWVMGALLILFTFVSTISYRNWKYEQEIVGLQWRINAAELTLGNHASVGSRVREVGLYSTSSSLNSRVRKYSLGPCASPYLLLVCQHLPVQLNLLFVTWPTILLRVLCVARGPVLQRTGGLL